MPECDINRVNAELDIVEANAKGRYFVKPGEPSIFYMKRVKKWHSGLGPNPLSVLTALFLL